MAPGCHIIGRLHQSRRHIGGDCTHLGVHRRCGALDHCERNNKCTGYDLARDGEILYGALGLRPPSRGCRHLDLAHRIVLDAIPNRNIVGTV